jgi:hypothetical protein
VSVVSVDSVELSAARDIQRTKSPRFPPKLGGVSRSVHDRDVGEKGIGIV